MSNTKKKNPMAENYSIKQDKQFVFTSPLALGLLDAVPCATDPIDAILWHAEMLVIESGMTKPPFTPATYAPLRGVKEVLLKNMEVDGRLIPDKGGFKIELNKNRPPERINFTFAHELGHTFFYESVPSIKYRTTKVTQPHYDEEEEQLCNIAASELLMPSAIFSEIVKDYSPTPESLQEISRIFETSLTATILKILKLKIWDATFILWNCEDDKIEAKWIARPNYYLTYSPKLELVNYKTTSVYQTYITGETLTNSEWFSLNGGYRLSKFSSKRMNSRTVLSCATNRSTQSSLSKPKTPPQKLPFVYKCECGGTGWRYINRDGIPYVTRCLASEHKNNQI